MWAKEEKAQLVKALGVVCKMQKHFGREPVLAEILAGYELILGGRYPVSLVMRGLMEYMRRKPDIPTAADIVAIIDPPQPKPSMAVYMAAQARLQRNHGVWYAGRTADEEAVKVAEDFERRNLAAWEEQRQALALDCEKAGLRVEDIKLALLGFE